MDQGLHCLHSANNVLESLLFRLFRGKLLNGLGSTLFGEHYTVQTMCYNVYYLGYLEAY